MKAQIFLAATSIMISLSAMAAAPPANLDLGAYTGSDASGKTCELDIVPMFGYHEMNSFNLKTANNYYFQVITGNAAPTSPSHISGQETLMFNGYTAGLPTYRSFEGAPILGPVIKVDYVITYSGHRPTSIALSQRSADPFVRTTESCGRLKRVP